MNSLMPVRSLLLTLVLTSMQLVPLASRACEIDPARQVVDLLVATEFEKATAVLEEWSRIDDHHPMLAFYQAVTLWARADAADESTRPLLQDQAIAALSGVIQGNTEQIGNESSKADEVLSLGMAQAFLARIYLTRGEWIRAYELGRAGRDTLRDLIKEDPDAKDAYLILGLYEYHTGSVPFLLRWLAHLIDLGGDADRGVAYLEKAAREAPIASPEAARALISEVGPLERRCRYISLARNMAERYSGNPQFSRIHGYLLKNCPGKQNKYRADAGAVTEHLTLSNACVH